MPTSLAARLCGMHERTLLRWAERGALKPTVHQGASRYGRVYGWTLRDVVAGRAIKQLRERVSAQHLRTVVRALNKYGHNLSSAVLIYDPRQKQIYQVLSSGDYLNVLDGQTRAVALKPIVREVTRAASKAGYEVAL